MHYKGKTQLLLLTSLRVVSTVVLWCCLSTVWCLNVVGQHPAPQNSLFSGDSGYWRQLKRLNSDWTTSLLKVNKFKILFFPIYWQWCVCVTSVLWRQEVFSSWFRYGASCGRKCNSNNFFVVVIAERMERFNSRLDWKTVEKRSCVMVGRVRG